MEFKTDFRCSRCFLTFAEHVRRRRHMQGLRRESLPRGRRCRDPRALQEARDHPIDKGAEGICLHRVLLARRGQGVHRKRERHRVHGQDSRRQDGREEEQARLSQPAAATTATAAERAGQGGGGQRK